MESTQEKFKKINFFSFGNFFKKNKGTPKDALNERRKQQIVVTLLRDECGESRTL